MSGAPTEQDPPRPSQNYGAYQISIYTAGMAHGKLPPVTCDFSLLEDQAKKCLDERAYNYVAGGAGERATMDANRLAFRQWKMIPRMLRPITHRDMSVNLFGFTYDSPILVSPIGVQSVFHPDKEIGVAEVAAQIGVPYVLSTASTSTIEEVADANDKGLGDNKCKGSRWYQLYWPANDETTISLLARAKKAGFAVLVVTLDTWTVAWRPSDLDLAFLPFFSGTGNAIGFSDPVFRKRFKDKYSKEVEDDVPLASKEWIGDVFSGRNHTWEQLELLKKHWDGPIILKGIQSVDDARIAVEHGVQGIIVSNHGGRQLDGAIGSLEVLPEIVEAVGDKITVLFDSGVRTGVDVIKALCLGAKAVLVGRPWVYGLGINGKEGAKHVLQSILADVDSSMGLAGIQDIKGCNRSMLRKVQYSGDVKTSK